MRHRIWLVGLLALAACKETKGDEKTGDKGSDKAQDRSGDTAHLAGSAADPSGERVTDDDYRFEITQPGAGWKVLGPHDAARIQPDGVAGTTNDAGLFGIVIVEAAPGVELDAFADFCVDKMPLAKRTIESRIHVDVSDEPAVRFVVTGAAEGTPLRYVVTAFIHQGFGYQVIAWGLESALPNAAPAQPFFDHFKLLPGKVRGRSSVPVITSARGVGWKVEHGVFQSAATGLRVSARPPWRLVAGTPMSQINGDAEVGLSRVDPEVYVILISERAPPPEARSQFIAHLREKMAGDVGAPWTGKFAGEDLQFTRITGRGALAFEYLHGVYFHGDLLFQVLAWYIVGDRSRAEATVQSALDMISFSDDAETQALASELETEPDTQGAAGPGYALRDGVYHSFSGRWTWTRTTALWQITTGDKARARNKDCELFLHEQGRNLYGLVITETTDMSSQKYHHVVVDKMEGKKSRARGVTVAGVVALQTTIDKVSSGSPMRIRMTTLTSGDKALQLMFWGTKDDMIAHADAVDAALGSFRRDDTAEVTRRGTTYRDNRFGFSIKAPDADWEIQDESAKGAASETIVSWVNGFRRIGVIAADSSGVDETWFLDYVEHLLHDRGGPMFADPPRRSEVNFAGQKARRLSWPGLDAYVLLRGHFLYALVTTEQNPDAFELF
jgi:hypothetical protein